MTTFIIKKTDNNVLCSIADGTANTTNSSLVLFGKNYAGYGPQLDENLVKLLENFCFGTAPQHPLQGQLWWNTTASTLNVYTPSGWKVVSGPTSSVTSPDSPRDGDLWWDTVNSQLYVYHAEIVGGAVVGGTWVLVGPSYTSAQGVSGAMTETVVGSSDNQPHVIIKFVIGGIVVAVLSSDATFATNDVPGFADIRPGFNLPTTYGQYVGNAENSLKLGNVLAANYLRSDVDSTTTHKLNIASESGLTVGPNADLSIKLDNGIVKIASNVVGGDIEFYYTDSAGTLGTALTIKSGSGAVLVATSPAFPQSVTSKQYVDSAITTASAGYLLTSGANRVAGDVVPNTTNTHSLGTTSARFKNTYSTNFVGDTLTVGAGVFDNITVINSSGTPDSVVTKVYVDNADSAAALLSASQVTAMRDQIVGSAPANLSTMGQIAAALANNPTFATDLAAQLALLAPKNSPNFSGTPMVPTVASNDISNKVASTAFVSSVTSNIFTMIATLVEANYAPILSPALVGYPTAPTMPQTDASSKLATTAYVKTAIEALIGGAPGTLDTLNELAQAIASDANFAASFTAALALKAPIANPVFTGSPQAPTPAQADSSTKLATTAYVTDKFAASVINPTFSGNVTVDNITVNQGMFTPINNTVDIGTPLRNFKTIYGTAMKANYADLAENYVADANYAPGTVLDFGGAKEVTLSTGKDLTKVAGVVSSNPAYLMNAGCTGEFVVAVALQGRVPCRVIGQVAKGDLLVSYGDGIARRHLKPDAGTIIGKALEVHAGEESMIEIVVGRC